MEKPNKGDLVRLKSGGPVMTVDSLNDIWCNCQWFTPIWELKEGKFYFQSLDPISEVPAKQAEAYYSGFYHHVLQNR